MMTIRNLRMVVCCATALLAMIPSALATEDKLVVATAQRGAWESAAALLGQQAGIFAKHGIALAFVFTQDDDATEDQVTSGSADLGLAVGAMHVMRSYARGAPLRIIGGQRAGSINYWYVPKSSPIRSVEGMEGRTIAYESNGSSSHYDVIDFMRRHGLKARLVLTGGTNATLAHVKAGIVDVGWGALPFGIDKIALGDIRVVARANDVPSIRNKTTSVMITHAETLQKRKPLLVRFLLAYREAVEWMYSDPAALRRYAELADMSEGVARELRDEFYSKEMLLPGRIIGLSAVVNDAMALRYLQKTLSRGQIRNLAPSAPATPIERVLCVFDSEACPLGLIGP
ncbi:MAG: ABC transporter substrate-binding protein [Xanthobacteraceae bacterium]